MSENNPPMPPASKPRFYSVEEFRQQFFSNPDPRTIRKAVNEGVLRGFSMGKKVYIDIEGMPTVTGNSLVDSVLAGRES